MRPVKSALHPVSAHFAEIAFTKKRFYEKRHLEPHFGPTSESQIVKTEASNAENVKQEKEKEKKVGMKEKEEATAFSPTLSKNPSSMTRISAKIIRLFLRIGNKTKLLLLLLRTKKSSSKQLKDAEESRLVQVYTNLCLS